MSVIIRRHWDIFLSSNKMEHGEKIEKQLRLLSYSENYGFYFTNECNCRRTYEKGNRRIGLFLILMN
jgi:hypothetical protein